MEKFKLLKMHLCSAILGLLAVIVVFWLSLAVLWVFPGNNEEQSENTTENVRLPKWAQGAEKVYSPLLFLVYPKEHKVTEGTKDQNKWLWMVLTFVIGLCFPSCMFLLDVAVIDKFTLIGVVLKFVCDVALLLYLLGGAFLLWWAWLF